MKYEVTGYDSAGMKVKHVIHADDVPAAIAHFMRAESKSTRPGTVEVVQVGPTKSEMLP